MTGVAPYEKLALIYDQLMKHVDYRSWANYINKLITKYHPKTKTILDASCGTGNLLAMLRRYPYDFLGCDFSLPMLKQAKVKGKIESIPIWRCSMVDLAVQKKVDVILSLYDSVNYIMEIENIIKFISNAEVALQNGGLLIFDICTERNAIKYFYNYYDHDSQITFKYDRWSHYDQKTHIQHTEFKVHFYSEKKTYLEKHKQKIYSIRAILDAINSTSMKLIDIYDGYTFQPANSKSNRIHFVLRLDYS